MTSARATLYAVPVSHPCAAVEAALRLKAVPYDRVDLLPVLHKVLQRARFGAGRVPGLVLDGEKITGSREIMRRLEDLVPAPPLFPGGDAGPEVERAEAWGDQLLQPLARRLTWAALRRAPSAIPSYSEGARLPVPARLAAPAGPAVAWAEGRIHNISDEVVRADLQHLRSHLDRVDRWIADGILGGDAANAADLQIGSALRLLLTLGDIAPAIDGRPAGALARRWFPVYPGTTPAGTFPPAWLENVA